MPVSSHDVLHANGALIPEYQRSCRAPEPSALPIDAALSLSAKQLLEVTLTPALPRCLLAAAALGRQIGDVAGHPALLADELHALSAAAAAGQPSYYLENATGSPVEFWLAHEDAADAAMQRRGMPLYDTKPHLSVPS